MDHLPGVAPLASVQTFLSLDLVPMLAISLSAVSCALLGNFLVLRRQALMGDAISHAVLPGLVIAVLLTRSMSPWAIFLGAAVAASTTALLIELVKRLGRVEPGAAMGVVFSVLFALGVLLLEQAKGLDGVDLDPNCVLYGQPEYLTWWGAPDTLAGLWDLSVWGSAPTPVFTLGIVAVGVVLLVTVLFKELRIASFDSALATTQGINAGVIHAVLMLAVAIATVASFEAVGSILVIAMLITPAATARLLTDRLSVQLWLSAIIAAGSAVGGYALAANAQRVFAGVFETHGSLNAAGTITVFSAGVFALAVVASPSQGLIAGAYRRRQLARRIVIEDLLGLLYRAWEQDPSQPSVTRADLRTRLRSRDAADGSVHASTRLGYVLSVGDYLELTEAGRRRAGEIVQRHRDWQGYLVEEAGLRPDHAHDRAHGLEHLPIESRGSSKPGEAEGP
ncbi:MAG: manganese/zinc/iron transport system permease protein [Phycisphaerales bacterium]|jgi:manganese/zinc/iron transport system permease protein